MIIAKEKISKSLEKISEINNLLVFGVNDGVIIGEMYSSIEYKEIKEALAKLEVWTKALLEKVR